MKMTDQLSLVAREFSSAKELSVGRVSTLVFGDGAKLAAVIAGRADLTTRRFEAALLWFSDNWPDDVSWPPDVLRPANAKADAA